MERNASTGARMTLYEDGRLLGLISEWKLIEPLPAKRLVLGKEIEITNPKMRCEFVSFKPLRRQKKYWVLTDDGHKLILSDLKIKGGTFVSAAIERESTQ
jgi:hypothetical protein